MTNLTRKQREVAERHHRFLAIARDLLRDEGFHHLSMDRVAELAEYSKGTVYQHFNCKEEMVGQLCINALQRLYALGLRAVRYPGSHRERLLAFFIANDVFQQLEGDAVCNVHTYQHDQIIAKVSPNTKDRHEELMHSIFNLVKGILDDAIRDGELGDAPISVENMVFGFWSLNHGAQTLRSKRFPLEKMGICEPGTATLSLLQCLLDGLGWKADGQEASRDQIEAIRAALLAEQHALSGSPSHSPTPTQRQRQRQRQRQQQQPPPKRTPTEIKTDTSLQEAQITP